MSAKAYTVTDSCGGNSVVVFHEHAVAARRLGALQLYDEFGDVRCKRSPGFDEFEGSGQIPKRVHG